MAILKQVAEINIQLSKAHQEIERRRKAEQERDRIIHEFKDTLSEVKTLKGFLPICSNCKSIRDDEGYWKKIESYIQDHSDAEFSHSICPECADKLYPELNLSEK